MPRKAWSWRDVKGGNGHQDPGSAPQPEVVTAELRRLEEPAVPEVPTVEASCGMCIFWQAIGGGFGLCKQRAPACGEHQSYGLKPLWPTVPAAEWCGQFKPV